MALRPFYSSMLAFIKSHLSWLRNQAVLRNYFPDFATTSHSAISSWLSRKNLQCDVFATFGCKTILLNLSGIARSWEVRKPVAKSCLVSKPAKSVNLTLKNKRVAKPWKLRKQKSCEFMRPRYSHHLNVRSPLYQLLKYVKCNLQNSNNVP